MAPRTPSASGDSSLDAAFGREQRVRVFHLLIDNFDTEHFDGTFDGYAGGEEQHILEKRLVRRLGRLELAKERNRVDRLQAFILNAPAAEILVLLELMPQARREYYESSTIGAGDLAKEIGNLQNRIVGLVREIGLSVAFDDEGALQRVDVDTTERDIHNLPGRDDLEATLPAILTSNSIVAVVFIDLDQFKAVNDRLGHDAGDKCLDQFVQLVSPIAKGRAKVYRYGGDEFALVMPNFTAEEAAATGERVRRVIETAKIGGEVRVTTSIGVASSADFAGAAALVAAADEAMYAAKKVDGPNQVRTAPLSRDIQARAAEERRKSKGR